MMEEILPELSVSRETFEKLMTFEALVKKWTAKINLIAPTSIEELWQRHILDSAQLSKLAPLDWTTWTDMGSGGGFPGIVLAILDDKKRPVSLIESDTRKSLFLRTAKRELDINVKVVNERIDKVEIPPADVLTARALSSLTDLLNYADRLLLHSGTALFPKGRRYQDELDQASQHWCFDVKLMPSYTNAESQILSLSGIKKREC